MSNYNSVYFKEQFPETLTKEETEKYFQLAKNGDEHAKNKIAEHNLKLLALIINRDFSTVSNEYPSIDVGDLMGISSIGLVKAIETFDIEKGMAFSTYAARVVSNEILMFIRQNQKSKNNISLDESLNEDKDGNEMKLATILSSDENIEENFIQNETRKEVRNSLKILNDLERQVIELYYGFNGERLTQYQIGKKLGYSQSQICRIDVKARLKLKEHLESQGHGIKRRELNEFDYINKLSSAERAETYAKLIVDRKITKENLARECGVSTASLSQQIVKNLPKSNPELYEMLTKVLEQQTNEKEQQRLKNQKLKKQLKLQEKEEKQKLREQYQNGYDRRNKVNITENSRGTKSKVNSVMEKLLPELFPNYTEEQIQDSINSLNETNRRIVELKYGLNGNPITSTKDIVEQLNIKYSTMAVRVVNVRRMLAKRLEKQQPILSQKKLESIVKTSKEESIEVITLDDKKIVKINGEYDLSKMKNDKLVRYDVNRVHVTSLPSSEEPTTKPIVKKSVEGKIESTPTTSKLIVEKLEKVYTKKESVENESYLAMTQPQVKELEDESDVTLITARFQNSVSLDFEKHKKQIKMLISMLNDPTEQVALLLRLGYVKDQYFTEQQISQFLNIDEKEIGGIINKGLSNIGNFSTITIQGVDSARQQLDLTKKSIKK